MAPFRGLSWGGTAYVVAVLLAALLVVVGGWFVHPVTPDLLPQFIYLAFMTQVAALMPLRWRRGVQTLDSMPLVAAALAAPGAGVALLAWRCLFDGRWPSKELPVWRLLFTRAKSALEFGIPSLLLIGLPTISAPFDVTIKTLIYSLGPVLIGYPLTARGFAFLDRATTIGEIYCPIGNNGWYSHGEEKALYDQQPVEAITMADAALAAFHTLNNPRYLETFRRARSWFHGENSLRQPVGDIHAGAGC